MCETPVKTDNLRFISYTKNEFHESLPKAFQIARIAELLGAPPPGPHKGPLSGPLDPTPLYAPLSTFAPLYLLIVFPCFCPINDLPVATRLSIHKLVTRAETFPRFLTLVYFLIVEKILTFVNFWDHHRDFDLMWIFEIVVKILTLHEFFKPL